MTVDFTLDQNWLIALIHRVRARSRSRTIVDRERLLHLQSTTFQHVHQSGKTHNLTATQAKKKIAGRSGNARSTKSSRAKNVRIVIYFLYLFNLAEWQSRLRK